MSDPIDDFGERVAVALVRCGASVSSLARVTEIPRARLVPLLRYERPEVTLEEFLALLRALRCSPDWLLGRSPDGAPPYAALRGVFAPRRSPDARGAPSRARGRSSERPRSVCIVAMARQIQAKEDRRAAQLVTAAARSKGHHAPSVPPQTRDVGTRLATLLSEAGIARADFARASGLAEGAVDELCRGRRKSLCVQEITSITKSLGCSASWLLGIDPTAPPVTRVWSSFVACGGHRRPTPRDAAQFARGPEDLVPLCEIAANGTGESHE